MKGTPPRTPPLISPLALDLVPKSKSWIRPGRFATPLERGQETCPILGTSCWHHTRVYSNSIFFKLKTYQSCSRPLTTFPRPPNRLGRGHPSSFSLASREGGPRQRGGLRTPSVLRRHCMDALCLPRLSLGALHALYQCSVTMLVIGIENTVTVRYHTTTSHRTDRRTE